MGKCLVYPLKNLCGWNSIKSVMWPVSLTSIFNWIKMRVYQSNQFHAMTKTLYWICTLRHLATKFWILKFISFLDFTVSVTGHATQIPGFSYLYFTTVAKTRKVLVTFYKVYENSKILWKLGSSHVLTCLSNMHFLSKLENIILCCNKFNSQVTTMLLCWNTSIKKKFM